MTNNGAVETLEIERKYAVSAEASWPGANHFAGLGLRLGEPERHELRARYFDTVDGALGALRVAVRERVGGKDQGWHLKAKGDEGARELLWPPADDLPAGLRREIASRVGEAALESVRTIATLHTERRTAMLYAPDGTAVIELADDRVDALNELADARSEWREWEAELMQGADPALLDRIEPLLREFGATRVRGTSKIQRAMQGHASAGHASASHASTSHNDAQHNNPHNNDAR